MEILIRIITYGLLIPLAINWLMKGFSKNKKK